MNNVYKTNFDLVVSDNKVFRYDVIEVKANQIIGSCYVNNYQQLFELAINCSYQTDNINAYVDQFYLVIKDENLYDDLKMILAIWKQKAPLIDNIGFMLNDNMIYQANNHPCAWYYVYIKNQLMKLIVTRSRWDDENDDISYRSKYQDLEQINPTYEPNKLKAEYEASKKQRERELEFHKQEEFAKQAKQIEQNRDFDQQQPDLELQEYRRKKQRARSDQYSSDRQNYDKQKYDNLRSFNQNQVDDLDLFDDRDQLGSLKTSAFNDQSDLKSYNSFLNNDDFGSSNNYLNDFDSKFDDSSMSIAKLGSISATGINDSLASLKQRMDDIDQQIGNYESITRELSDLANSDSFSFDYTDHSTSSTLGLNDYGLDSSSSITSTSGLKDLNSYEFNESTKDMLLHHSEDFND
ncbi:hypothetical protein H3143_01200 [Mycoplasma tullyi]|uniref:Uncharacterized protein n=1 Tax=Mycoplasma tullyi TaxID=1612150 RepID=A0A7D7Y8H8_9MOLU|nr:hypothetical protein [Mycoplasma tullyi]QMT98735.1 hypothetical protein H3143_01200 [Mycoplasma tullyi]